MTVRVANYAPFSVVGPRRANPAPYPGREWLGNWDWYDLTTIQTPNAPVVLPRSDTIRGGRVILLSENLPLDESELRDERLTGALPAGWLTSRAGSGSVVPTKAGLLLSTGRTASSSCLVTTDDTNLIGFDLALDVELLDPLQPLQVAFTPVALQALMRRGDVAQLALVFDRRRDLVRAIATFTYTPFGGAAIASGEVAVAPPFKLTLRLVRNGPVIWAFVGQRDPTAGADAYSSTTPVGRIDNAAPDYVTPRVFQAGGRATMDVRARVTNYTIRSHVLIGTRLLEDKQVVFHKQILGHVPAVELTELGLKDVTVFGPYGSAVARAAFNYVLPDVLTLSQGSQASFATVTDPALFDGPRRTKRRGGR